MAVSAKACKIDEQMIESGKYYDMLDSFDKTIRRLNQKAADGERVKTLQSKCQRLLPAFVLLCGDLQEVAGSQKKQKEPESNLIVRDGWGLCPNCGKKCIKVAEETKLVNHPMFCKVCRCDYVVSWKG